mmetsp:Transcript_21266/g.40377  ORF Transcript_21266/g.40377 Transcript_21266/m.40377 type:complete len:214 (-) Transcript_21266:890-1531(-)
MIPQLVRPGRLTCRRTSCPFACIQCDCVPHRPLRDYLRPNVSFVLGRNQAEMAFLNDLRDKHKARPILFPVVPTRSNDADSLRQPRKFVDPTMSYEDVVLGLGEESTGHRRRHSRDIAFRDDGEFRETTVPPTCLVPQRNARRCPEEPPYHSELQCAKRNSGIALKFEPHLRCVRENRGHLLRRHHADARGWVKYPLTHNQILVYFPSKDRLY